MFSHEDPHGMAGLFLCDQIEEDLKYRGRVIR